MVEKVKYHIVRNLGKVELRRYGPLLVARVDGFSDGGFDLLFGYISGRNREGSKVAMTAPVIHQRDDSGAAVGSQRIAMTAPVISDRDSMAFVMPAELSLDTAPEPLDGRVHIEELPGRHLAVLQFSGRWTEKAYRRRSGELLEALEEFGIKPGGQVFYMLYNPPFTPPFLRRNEVAVEVDLD